MNNVTITRIPIPSEILKGEWYGIVYAIDTESESFEAHNAEVEDVIEKLKEDYDNNDHYTVSLREVKRQLVYSDECIQRYCTLVQFRVRDSY